MIPVRQTGGVLPFVRVGGPVERGGLKPALIVSSQTEMAKAINP